MKQYRILNAFASLELEQKVNEHINDGWQPLGGVQVSYVQFPAIGSSDILWAQAMVKD